MSANESIDCAFKDRCRPRRLRLRSTLIKDWLEAVDLVLLQRAILSRASEPFPTPLGTLDALHLATALVWRDRTQQELVMMTHDGGLATAARAFGIQVIGSAPKDEPTG